MTHRVLSRQNPSGLSPLSEVQGSVFPLSTGTGQLTTPHPEVTHHRTSKTKKYNVPGSNSIFMILNYLPLAPGTLASNPLNPRVARTWGPLP